MLSAQFSMQRGSLRDFFSVFSKKSHVIMNVLRLVRTNRGVFLMEKEGETVFHNMSRACRLPFSYLV
jgi:hypothetical protein